MRCYGLRAALFAAALCAALVAMASLWLGLVGAAAVSALLVALGWITYFHSERAVLTALRARQVSEVERPDLYRLVQGARPFGPAADAPAVRVPRGAAEHPHRRLRRPVGGGVLHGGAAGGCCRWPSCARCSRTSWRT